MRAILAALAASIIITAPAHAATAILVSCDMATSVTGLPVWVGMYEINGQHFTRTFSSYCPASVSVR